MSCSSGSCAQHPRAQRPSRREHAERGYPYRAAEAERERLAIPACYQQAADRLDQVGDGVVGRDRGNQSVSIRLRGSAFDDRKSSTNSSGNRPWTASPDPVRSAASAPIEPKPSVTRIDSASSTGIPAGPALKPAPTASPTARNTTACAAPSATTPASCPVRSDGLVSGVSDSRERKPLSMSSAMFVPALLDANSAPWMNGTASANVR